LSKVSLDWQIINDNNKKKDEALKILAVAVPNEIVSKYKSIASSAGLDLKSLEAEVFGLIRSVVKDDELLALVDIGKESTNCSIIEDKTLKISHSFDAGGGEMTRKLMKDLNIDYNKAEEIKKKSGILGDKDAKQSLLSVIDKILKEVNDSCDGFSKNNGRKIRKVILSGGPSLLPGIKEYFSKETGMNVEIANPFSNLIYPSILEKSLREMGPLYAVSVGMALGGLK
jgi:type IV pilus assembly protein PilM